MPDKEVFDKFIDIYSKYNPKAKDLLVIEEKEKKHNELIKKLQDKENKLTNDVRKKEEELEIIERKLN